MFDPDDANKAYCLTIYNLYESTDGGRTWSGTPLPESGRAFTASVCTRRGQPLALATGPYSYDAAVYGPSSVNVVQIPGEDRKPVSMAVFPNGGTRIAIAYDDRNHSVE